MHLNENQTVCLSASSLAFDQEKLKGRFNWKETKPPLRQSLTYGLLGHDYKKEKCLEFDASKNFQVSNRDKFYFTFSFKI
jgi:hypothetical protein